jgi:hypothetical protein
MSQASRKLVVYKPYNSETQSYVKAIIKYVCDKLGVESLCQDVEHYSEVDNIVHVLQLLRQEMDTLIAKSPFDASAKDTLKMMVVQKAVVLPSVYAAMIGGFAPVHAHDGHDVHAGELEARKREYLQSLSREIEDLEADCATYRTDRLTCTDLLRLISNTGMPRRLWLPIASFNANLLAMLRDAAAERDQ